MELDPQSLYRDLSAFADGELDPAATDRLLRRLAADPAAAATLRDVQRLSHEGRRVVRNQTPPLSDAQRDRLDQMALATRPATRSDALPRSTRAWWAAAPRVVAAAALAAIGGWAGYQARRPAGFAVPSPAALAAEVRPAAVAATGQEVHGVCSRLALGLHSGECPADVAALAPSVEQDLRSDRPYPDLTSIGYREAGPCGRPLVGAAQLLYRFVQPGSVNAVGVFVQAWPDPYPLVPGRLYTVPVARGPVPMPAWPTDRVVHFLLADDAATETAAADVLRCRPATGP